MEPTCLHEYSHTKKGLTFLAVTRHLSPRNQAPFSLELPLYLYTFTPSPLKKGVVLMVYGGSMVVYGGFMVVLWWFYVSIILIKILIFS